MYAICRMADPNIRIVHRASRCDASSPMSPDQSLPLGDFSLREGSFVWPCSLAKHDGKFSFFCGRFRAVLTLKCLVDTDRASPISLGGESMIRAKARKPRGI